jgi:membrane protease YdiL (CAAX protease family)
MDTIRRERLDAWSMGVLVTSLFLMSGLLGRFLPRDGVIPVSLFISVFSLAVCFVRASRVALSLALLTTLTSLWAFTDVWPRGFPFTSLVPLVIFVGVVRFTRLRRTVFRWLGGGRIERSLIPFLCLIVVLAAVGQFAWFRLSDPDLNLFREMIPKGHFGLVVSAGLAFALINAVVEEAIYRGVIQGALESAFGLTWFPLIVQALVFGYAHFEGIPSGWSGVLLATSYGFVLGIMKRRNGGMMAPILVHFFADLVIFGILVGFIV